MTDEVDVWTAAAGFDLYITCACGCGLSPQQLVERMADHQPVEIGPALTIQEAHRMVDLAEIYCAGRRAEWRMVVRCGVCQQ